MTYTEAKKALHKTGTAHATGDSLAAMYADLIPFHCCLRPQCAGKFYSHLRQLPDDQAIASEGRRFLRNPLDCFDII